MKIAILICIALALFIICFLIKINLGVKNIERVEKVPDCLNCEIRKFYANAFDTHFDYKDCPIDCKAKKKQNLGGT